MEGLRSLPLVGPYPHPWDMVASVCFEGSRENDDPHQTEDTRRRWWSVTPACLFLSSHWYVVSVPRLIGCLTLQTACVFSLMNCLWPHAVFCPQTDGLPLPLGWWAFSVFTLMDGLHCLCLLTDVLSLLLQWWTASVFTQSLSSSLSCLWPQLVSVLKLMGVSLTSNCLCP